MPVRPVGKTQLLSLAQALRERRRPNSMPKPTKTNAALLGSGIRVPSISYESQRRVATPPAPLVLTAGSEYSPNAVTGSAGRVPTAPPSTRDVPGTKVNESQILPAQFKTNFCPLVAKTAADAVLLLWTSNWSEAYQLPSIWTAIRYP